MSFRTEITVRTVSFRVSFFLTDHQPISPVSEYVATYPVSRPRPPAPGTFDASPADTSDSSRRRAFSTSDADGFFPFSGG